MSNEHEIKEFTRLLKIYNDKKRNNNLKDDDLDELKKLCSINFNKLKIFRSNSNKNQVDNDLELALALQESIIDKEKNDLHP